MGTIKQATYGDEKSSTDVTDVIVKMYKEGKNSLSVVAGPSILSKREAGVKVSLNDEENQEIRKQALESCGNALDANCMKTTQDSLRSSKLEEKAQKEASKPIVGERLTVTVVDGRGKEKKLVIPKDQTFKFGAAASEKAAQANKAWDEFQKIFTIEKLGPVVSSIVFYFVWAFGTAFAWIILGQEYAAPGGGSIDPGEFWWLKYLGAGVAVATAGYGGFAVVLAVFIILGAKHYIIQRSLLMTKQ
jgi:hypothetical protein